MKALLDAAAGYKNPRAGVSSTNSFHQLYEESYLAGLQELDARMARATTKWNSDRRCTKQNVEEAKMQNKKKHVGTKIRVALQTKDFKARGDKRQRLS